MYISKEMKQASDIRLHCEKALQEIYAAWTVLHSPGGIIAEQYRIEVQMEEVAEHLKKISLWVEKV